MDLQLTFGNEKPKSNPVRLLANQNGCLKKVAKFDFDEFHCELNKDLADYFKVFYSGQVQVNLSLSKGGPVFAHSSIDIKQSLRQKKQASVVAYEASIYDSVTFQNIGSLYLVSSHEGKFVNPQILSQIN